MSVLIVIWAALRLTKFAIKTSIVLNILVSAFRSSKYRRIRDQISIGNYQTTFWFMALLWTFHYSYFSGRILLKYITRCVKSAIQWVVRVSYILFLDVGRNLTSYLIPHVPLERVLLFKKIVKLPISIKISSRFVILGL